MRYAFNVLRIFAALLCLTLFLSPLEVYATQDIAVEAEGQAPIINGDKARARDEAKRQAYRDALEKGIGAYVEGITEMKDFQVVRDKVFSQSQGLVTDFKVISETVEDGDVFILKASCKVSVKKLDGVLGPIVIDALGNPRVMVVVDENIGGERPFLSTVEGETLRLFEKAGYLLVDPEQAKRLNQREYELARDSGDMGRLQELAKHFDADVLIYGRAQALPTSEQRAEGIKLFAVLSQLQLKAILTQTAYVVGTEKFEHKDKGTSVQGPAVKGLTVCAHQASLALVHKVAYSLVSGSAGGIPGRTVKLRISEVSFGDARKIKGALEESRGVTAVYQRAYNNRKLELDVNTEGDAEELAIRLDELGVEITGLTANTVEGVLTKE